MTTEGLKVKNICGETVQVAWYVDKDDHSFPKSLGNRTEKVVSCLLYYSWKDMLTS